MRILFSWKSPQHETMILGLGPRNIQEMKRARAIRDRPIKAGQRLFMFTLPNSGINRLPYFTSLRAGSLQILPTGPIKHDKCLANRQPNSERSPIARSISPSRPKDPEGI